MSKLLLNKSMRHDLNCTIIWWPEAEEVLQEIARGITRLASQFVHQSWLADLWDQLNIADLEHGHASTQSNNERRRKSK